MVPVEQTFVLVVLPFVGKLGEHIFVVIVVRREVAVVVGTRVGSVVPVEGRCSAATEHIRCRGLQFHSVVDVPVVREDYARLVVVADLGVADLAVLVSPVGIVVVCAKKFVGFGSCCARPSATRRRTENGKSEAVVVVEFLFGTEEVGVAFVECARNVAFLCQTG